MSPFWTHAQVSVSLLLCLTDDVSLAPNSSKGEKLKCWNVITDSNMFCELVTDFLQDHPTPSGEPIAELPVPPAPPVVLNHKIVEMSEEEQLNAAIAASLQEPIKICDDDDEIETFSCDDDDSPVEVENHVKVNNADKIADVRRTTKDSEKTTASVEEDYTMYLGEEKETADLVLRFPDGQREMLTVPIDSKLKVSPPFGRSCF